MRSTWRTNLIALLTLFQAAISLFVLYQVIYYGLWFGGGGNFEWFHLYAFTYYYSIIFPSIAIPIGAFMITKGSKSKKINTMFQSVFIVVMVTDVVVLKVFAPEESNFLGDMQVIIPSIIVSVVILALLLKNQGEKD